MNYTFTNKVKELIEETLLNEFTLQEIGVSTDIIIKSFEGASFRRAKMIPSSIEWAAAIEMFHNAALIHDDIIDKAETRRFRKSLRAIIGEPCALLIGNILYSLAYELFLKGLIKVEKPDDQVFADTFWMRTYKSVQLGQALDYNLEGKKLEIGDYEEIGVAIAEVNMYKTASYTFILPAALEQIASRNGQIEQKEIMELIEKGQEFQNDDDYSNIFGSAAETGKPSMSDIYSKKKTNLLIESLKAMPSEQEKKIVKLYNSKKPISAAEAEYIKNCIDEIIDESCNLFSNRI